MYICRFSVMLQKLFMQLRLKIALTVYVHITKGHVKEDMFCILAVKELETTKKVSHKDS